MDFRFGGRTDVIENRTKFLEKENIAYQEHIAMRCDHSSIISLVDDKSEELGATSQETQIHSEVIVTRKKHIALMLFTADCLPVSFYDPITQTIALAHVSRKTFLSGLPQKTVSFLHRELNVVPSNLLIYIGPHIHKESYAFKSPLAETHEDLQNFIEEKNGFAHINLAGASIQQLVSSGIKKDHIIVSPEDTGTSADYYSYFMMKKNNETNEARMATILMMR
jgi:hypothetical protein